ncbi:MAG TPA: response regulator [Elusimicrobiota bacterium]|nr:response regulator [Elusimicrobiota bacterium]
MNTNEKDVVVLIAEDDDDDYLLTKKAFQDAGFKGSFCRVKNGVELMEALLLHENISQAPGAANRPMLLLLDLNMPCKDGRETLKEIKSHPDLQKIPVVVLTTSMSEADVAMSYEMGANSFIHKPARFDHFVESVKSLKKYWFEVAELPHRWIMKSVP